MKKIGFMLLLGFSVCSSCVKPGNNNLPAINLANAPETKMALMGGLIFSLVAIVLFLPLFMDLGFVKVAKS